MIVRLHQLSARAPRLMDLEAVVALIHHCEQHGIALAEPAEEDLSQRWQTGELCLQTDAWVIGTRQGQIVGYGEVRWSEPDKLAFVLRVHPEYSRRGIATLLLWLIEDRARQKALESGSRRQVTLSCHISSRHIAARMFLLKEGYGPTNHFWRLMLEMDEQEENETDVSSGKLRMDLVVHDTHTVGTTQLARRTGFYIMHQYDIYEKVLSTGLDSRRGTDQEEITVQSVR